MCTKFIFEVSGTFQKPSGPFSPARCCLGGSGQSVSYYWFYFYNTGEFFFFFFSPLRARNFAFHSLFLACGNDREGAPWMRCSEYLVSALSPEILCSVLFHAIPWWEGLFLSFESPPWIWISGCMTASFHFPLNVSSIFFPGVTSFLSVTYILEENNNLLILFSLHV